MSYTEICINQDTYTDLELWKVIVGIENIGELSYLVEYIEYMRKAVERNGEGLVEFERHHVVPKSFIANSYIVRLTYEEHFEAHKLLAKCFSGIPKRNMYTAWIFMSLGKCVNSTEYAEIRRNVKLTGENNSFFGKKHTKEARQRMAAKRLGSKASIETRIKMSNSGFGKPKSEETKERMRKPKTEEHAKNISKAQLRNNSFKGRKHSDETKALLVKQRTGRIWVNNGCNERFVILDVANILYSDGWVHGRILHPRKRKG